MDHTRFLMITTALFLIDQATGNAPLTTTEAPTDFVAVLDVSGSMSWNLPQHKRELKNMLPRILRPGDTFSLIYFSGLGESGLLLDQVQIGEGGQRLKDVSAIHQVIDGLDTIGLTAFVEPLVLLTGLLGQMRKARPRSRRAWIFSSDGWDNSSPGTTQAARRENIMRAVRDASIDADSVTTIGVDYSCDQSLLQAMAASAGGTFLFARDMAQYNANFETALSRRPAGARLRPVTLLAPAVADLAWTVAKDGTITQYVVADGAVSLPENEERIYYLSERSVGKAITSVKASTEAVYAGLALFGQRFNRKISRALAFALHDRRFIEMALGAFGPQRYNHLAEEAGKAVANPDLRWSEGTLEAPAPNPNAYTVMHAIKALANGNNRIVPGDSRFSYTPITRARISSAEIVTSTDFDGVTEAVRSVKAGAPVGDLDDAIAALMKIRSAKAPSASYKYQDAPEGYPVDGIVTSSKEANVSLRIKRPIFVDVSKALKDLPAELGAKLINRTAVVPSFRYQTFAVVTGRVLGLSAITCILDEPTWNEFAREGLLAWPYRREVVVVDLSRLPMINDSLIDDLSAEETIRVAYELETVKAELKVVSAVTDLFPKDPSEAGVKAWIDAQGLSSAEEKATVEAWLARIGVTDGGFSPPSTGGEKKADRRVSWLLKIGIPGLSNLPTVEDVRAKLAKIKAWKADPKAKGKEPKLTTGESLMAPHLADLDAFLAGHKISLDDLEGKDSTGLLSAHALLKAWTEKRLARCKPLRQDLLLKLNGAAIVAICGGEWFHDLPAGTTSLDVALPASAPAPTTVKINVEDVEIDI